MSLGSLSVIVPCKNEEKYIARCVNRLLQQKQAGREIEIVVVDNGSTDSTQEILKAYDGQIDCHSRPNVTISEVRNCGAYLARGEWLAFVDGDVEVDSRWGEQIEAVISGLIEAGCDTHSVVIGSTCGIPQCATWVETAWFNQLIERDSNSKRYVNSGHLIVHRDLFRRVGGFDPLYKTGEDVKFCEDVGRLGGSVVKDGSIKVVHHGYPKTLWQFFRRERWHGMSMQRHLLTPWRSKDLSFVIYIISALVLVGIPSGLQWGLGAGILGSVALILGPIVILSYKRSRRDVRGTGKLALLFTVYSAARFVALGDMLRLGRGSVSRFKDR